MRVLTSFIRPFQGLRTSISCPSLNRHRPATAATIVGSVQTNSLSSSSTKSVLKNLENAHAQVLSIRSRLPIRAQQLLDKGALKDLVADSKGRLIAPHFSAVMDTTPEGAERHETVVAFNVMLRHLHVVRKCCPECLYPRHRCVCGRIRRPPPPTRANLWVFQHFAEFGRANNSGSLLCLIGAAKRVIRGIAEDQDRLLEDLMSRHEADGSACVLYPSEDSIPLDQFVRARKERIGEVGIQQSPLSVVVLDGTGRQARNLERFLPSQIPRVRLPVDEEFGCRSWLNPVRLQTEAHRVCTAQAAAVMLEVLGEGEVSRAIEHAVKTVANDGARDRETMPPPLVPKRSFNFYN